jgi:sugar phosphate isomerase/epimerase
MDFENRSQAPTMPHSLALHHLSLRDVAPEDLPGIAREAGLSQVSVFVQAPSPELDIFPRVTKGKECKAFNEACRAADVSVHNIEVFSLGPDTRIADFEPALDLGAEIGARRLTALVQDPDLSRAAARMAALAEAAQSRGMAVSIEFMRFSRLRSIEAGADFVARVGHANLTLLVDPLHLFRTGGRIGSLAAIDPALIGAAQFCDGPMAAPANAFAEAVEDRAIPGEGEFPLVDFISALPGGCPLDIEVPMKRLADAGHTPSDRARRLCAATRRILEGGAKPAGSGAP